MRLRYIKTFEGFTDSEKNIETHNAHTTKVDKMADKVKEENNDVHRILTCTVFNRTDINEDEDENENRNESSHNN